MIKLPSPQRVAVFKKPSGRWAIMFVNRKRFGDFASAPEASAFAEARGCVAAVLGPVSAADGQDVIHWHYQNLDGFERWRALRGDVELLSATRKHGDGFWMCETDATRTNGRLNVSITDIARDIAKTPFLSNNS